jgi:hypothetical protein
VARKKDKRKSESGKRLERFERVPRPGPEARSIAPIRREQRFTSIVPVRFEPMVLDEVRRRAESDQRSVSAWIRRAVEAELRRGDTPAGSVIRRANE